MPLPKGMTSDDAWVAVAVIAWALFMSSIFVLVPDAESPLALITIIVVAGYCPVAFYVFWLRKRITKAKEPNSELLLKIEQKKGLLASYRRENLIFELVPVMIFGLSGLYCLGMIAFQCYVYLRYGEWITKSWDDMGWFVPQTTWVGAQSIINWVADQHAGGLVIVLGFAASRLFGVEGNSTYHVEREIKELQGKLRNSSHSD